MSNTIYTLPLLILLLILSSFPLFGQTKVWEATSPTTIDYLTISQDGSTLASVYGDSLYIWKTSDTAFVKKVVFTIISNPIISANNKKVYCIGKVNSVFGLYTIPIDEDTLYFNKLVEFPNYMSSGSYIIDKVSWRIFSRIDTNSLLFSYSYITVGGNRKYHLGRSGVLSIDAKQTIDFKPNSVNRIDYNLYNDQWIASGNSYEDSYSLIGPYVANPYLSVFSLSAGKVKCSIKTEYSSIGACRDSNYVLLEGQLFHIPSNDFVRALPTTQGGNYHSCSQNQDFYIGIKGSKNDTLTIVRYDSDTADIKIYCGGTITYCQLSADSRSIAFAIKGKTISVYEIPNTISHATLQVDFTSDVKVPYKGGSIQFRNNSYITDSKYSILWEFGDGDTSSLLHPNHVYSTPGVYSVQLRIITASKDTSIVRKVNYINYLDITKPIGAAWSKKYTNAGSTALGFTRDSIFVGTNDGSLLSMDLSGKIGRFLVKNDLAYYSFPMENNSHINPLHFTGLACNERTGELYAIGVPLGYSGYLKMYKYDLIKGSNGKYIDLGPPGYISELVGGNVSYSESKDGGFSSIDFNSDSTHLHYSNYGNISYSWTNSPPATLTFSRASTGNYSGTLQNSTDEILYDNGYFPKTNYGISVNPKFRESAEKLANLNVTSIRGGLPYNPNSYFIIAKNNVHHIRYGTFDLIAKFPTKGTILRHSPDQYHSFTSDGVWSFADGKLIDSLPLLAARSFEVFPDGVHLLVMYPKSDTVAIFNTQTKTYEQYFKANFIISSIAIAKDGKSFATGDTGGIVTLWQTPKLSIIKKIEFISPQPDKNHVKGDTVQFFNTSVPVNAACRNEWDFGDGTTSQERIPKHVYRKAGKYSVTLRAYCPPESGLDSTVDILEKAAYITVTDTVTSVENGEIRMEQSHLSITPNPIVHQGIITVNFAYPEHFSVRIITLLGQEILIAKDALSSHEVYAIPPISRGVYTCQLRFGNGEIISQQFVVSE